MIHRVLGVLPLSIRNLMESLPAEEKSRLEEIRVRQDRPLEIITTEQSRFVTPKGRLTRDPREAYRPSGEDCRKMLNLISNHSLYALEEELRRGYVTIEGGHRIGLAGKVVVEGGRVKHLRDITGFNVRIARQIPGVAGDLIPYLFQGGRAENVLIVSPPQCGKTTLLRDLARIASTGEKGLSPLKVGIVDERSELAGCVQGIPQHDVGPRTDVLDGCPKAEGMMMMIRSMSPDILVVDEIGRREDGEAVYEAVHAGVQVFTTAHGRTLEEVCRRPTISALARDGVFGRYVLLSRRRGPGTVEGVFDRSFRRVGRMEMVRSPC
jgi:stage III sporulation protein AA